MDLSSAIQKLTKNPRIPELFPGDTVKVSAQVKEGDRVRTQVFQGVVISKGGAGPSTCFTVRRISYGIGVERTYLVYSPLVESVEVLRRGSVRRAKLFYLRGLSAKDARIKEKARRAGVAEEVVADVTPEEASPAPADAPAADTPVAEAPAATPQAAASQPAPPAEPPKPPETAPA